MALDFNVPIANAVLTTENEEQAQVRAAEKGADAARVAVEMANLASSLSTLSDGGGEDDEDDDFDEDDDEDEDEEDDEGEASPSRRGVRGRH